MHLKYSHISPQRGFSLIEAMVAIVVMALGILGILGVQLRTWPITRRACGAPKPCA